MVLEAMIANLLGHSGVYSKRKISDNTVRAGGDILFNANPNRIFYVPRKRSLEHFDAFSRNDVMIYNAQAEETDLLSIE